MWEQREPGRFSELFYRKNGKSPCDPIVILSHDFNAKSGDSQGIFIPYGEISVLHNHSGPHKHILWIALSVYSFLPQSSMKRIIKKS